MPDSTPAPPRYLEIRQVLREAIVSGAWPPGHRLPPEPQLAEQFGCARMTLMRAISALVTEGLLVRRRRAGTFVATPRVQETVLEIHDIPAEVRAAGRQYDFDRLRQRRRRATAVDAERLVVGQGAPLLAIQGVHRANGAPIALEERLINLEVVPLAAQQSFEGIAPGSWLLETIPWTEAEHEIEAVNADAATAALLDLAPGAACLSVVRRTWRGASSVTWVRLTYPGKQHKLTGRFRAEP